MRILVLGATGMMGHMLCRLLGRHHEIYGAVRAQFSESAPLARILPKQRWLGGLDSFHIASVVRALERACPDAVINCVGVVKQLDEAHDPLTCIPVNSVFPHEVGALCHAAG